MTEGHDFRVRRVAAPLRQSVVESIRDAILTGRYRSGDRLPERELCDLIGVSRTLVREALRQLEAERLVKVIPNRGPVVETVTIEAGIGIYQVREKLEGLAAALFAVRASAAERKTLEKAFLKLRKAYSVQDPLALLRAKSSFYGSLVAGSGNAALGATLDVLNGQIRLLQGTWQRDPARDVAIIAELSVLVDALLAGNAEAAQRASEEHVRSAARVALERLSRAGLQPSEPLRIAVPA